MRQSSFTTINSPDAAIEALAPYVIVTGVESCP